MKKITPPKTIKKNTVKAIKKVPITKTKPAQRPAVKSHPQPSLAQRIAKEAKKLK